MKVFELAKELDTKALDLIEKIKPLGLEVKNHMSTLTPEQEAQIRNFLAAASAAQEEPKSKKTATRKSAAEPKESNEPKKIVVRSRKSAADAPSEEGAAASTVRAASSESSKTPTLLRRKNVIVRREPISEETSSSIGDVPALSSSEASSGATEAIEAVETTEATPDTLGDEARSAVLRSSAAQEEDDPLLEKDEDLTKDLASEFTEEMFTQSRVQKEEDEDFSAAAQAADPELSAAATTAPVEGAPRRSLSRYSVIRVVAPTTAIREKPLIVKDVDPAYTKSTKEGSASGTRSLGGQDFPRIPSPDILKEIESDDGGRKKRTAAASRTRAIPDAAASFRSTDFLRRERVYQPRKRKLVIGRPTTSSKNTTVAPSARKRYIEFNKEITVESLASQLSMKAKELARRLVKMGLEFPQDAEGLHDWVLDLESTQLIAEELGYDVRDITPKADTILNARIKSNVEEVPRPPVITIMGHVDHGKTSLLDLIRRTRVVSGEAGGITQHIGAYSVSVNEAIENLELAVAGDDPEAQKAAKKSKKEAQKHSTRSEKAVQAKAEGMLTFLDTPGHAAFSAIRSRGAQCTDIVILVVAATEGVMPQTREAIDHAKAAKVPVIVAMNKMDLPDANPDRIRQQLSELGLVDEAWGGDTIFVPVSAKTGMGVDKLLEMIQLQAEVLELKARDKGPADGIIIEAKLDKNRGPLATVLIRNGLLKVGDFISAGEVYGKVRALIDDKGVQVKEAGPSMPVEIMGLNGVPEAGDALNATQDEKSARALAELRSEERRKQEATPKLSSVDDILAMMAAGDLKELPIIIKADVRGSSEAIQSSLEKLPQNKVRLKILSTGVGGISENDVQLAAASKAIIIGFNVRPDSKAQAASERLGVPIKIYSIIYNLVDEVSNAMAGLLEPTIKETVLGQAEVRAVYQISKIGAVAGCMVTSGKLQRSAMARVVRDGRVVYSGKFSGLKRFKDDAKEVAAGFECGVSVENYNDIKVGDVIECYFEEKVFPTLDGAGANSAQLRV
jgi:translation initiation factor IF-2